jgi:hypothetical protein
VDAGRPHLLEGAVDVEQSLGVLGQAPQRLGQPVRFYVDGNEAVREVARVLVGLLDVLGDFGHVVRAVVVFVLQVAGQVLAQQADAGEHLPEAVVQVLPDAAALLLADAQYFFFEAAALADVADNPGKNEAVVEVELADG